MKQSLGRGLAWAQIALQAGLFLPPTVSAAQSVPLSPFSVDNGAVVDSGPAADSGSGSDAARALAGGAAGQAAQQWLSGFGTARVDINMDRHGGWGHSAADLLVPLYDNQRSVLFIQGGIRKPDDRLTGNIGFGVRTFWQNGWMVGGNTFFDDDFTGKNRRVGIGGEAWTDYLRLSGNTYIGTTQWHDSRDFNDYQEKPASGYDLRAEGWLPAYPQLGAKLMWEQYYGDNVALFDKKHLQHNPYAVTAGLNYTPVPLVTLGIDQKQGKGRHDTLLAVNFRWSLGHDAEWQVAPDNVQVMRTLAGSRYDLVNRNNEIVLQYRRKAEEGVSNLVLSLVTDNSPADGVTQNVLQVLATNRNGQPVRNAPVSWSVPTDGSVTLASSSSVTNDSGIATVSLTSTKAQTVPVTAQSGSASATQATHFAVNGAGSIAMAVTQNNATADNSSTDTVVATVTDGNGQPLSGKAVSWSVPATATLKSAGTTTDANGQVTAQIVSGTAGSISVTATADDKTASQTVSFVADTPRLAISVVRNDGAGNGLAMGLSYASSSDEVSLTVTNSSGTALSGQAVRWSASSGTVTFNSTSTTTDSSGQTSVTLTDTASSETVTVTATLEDGSEVSTDVRFVPTSIPPP